MMTLVRLIDLFVEFVKILLGQGSGGPIVRVLAWLVVIAVGAVAVALVAWFVVSIPAIVDTINGS
ncbi:hypothetical protein ABLE94_04530 [Gordonia sp. VNK1]|uniref:hypothetical protein n=1 Tax=Gordonia oleivorans TaxID=3156618 RepID=UPI0032B5ACBF